MKNIIIAIVSAVLIGYALSIDSVSDIKRCNEIDVQNKQAYLMQQSEIQLQYDLKQVK